MITIFCVHLSNELNAFDAPISTLHSLESHVEFIPHHVHKIGEYGQ